MTSNKLLNRQLDELNVLMVKAYNKSMSEVYALLLDTYGKILGADGKPLASSLYSYNRYYTLIKKLDAKLSELSSSEERILDDKLTKLYKDNEKIIGQQLGISTNIDDDKIRLVLSKDWTEDGLNYSDRIWKNKTQMLNKLKDNLIQSISTGRSLESYSSNLQDNLLVKGYYPISRLCRTEMSRIQLQSTIDKYKEAGITKLRINSTDDDRTCDYCRERNGKVIDIDSISDGGSILAHPQCRCYVTTVFE